MRTLPRIQTVVPSEGIANAVGACSVPESVELATILLTDLVGSTRLATSVGPARADELRDEHFELLRDAIASFGGREIKNTGDGMMVAFSSASAAVRCAVAMQQRFERRYRQAEQSLHVRIGLGAGESTVKDGDYFGMPSIEAARLCAQTPADGILVSALVHALAGRCEGIEFLPAGELELKGFEERVTALSVSWAPLAEETGAASRWPLPAVLRSVPPIAYVGRLQERAALAQATKLARSGERQVVLLAGEPGIGKTRLASFAAHGCHAEGFAVCWGGCSDELAVPYEPWIEVCSQLVQDAPADLLDAHVKRHGGELSRLVRDLGDHVRALPAPQSSDPETERYLLFNAVVDLLREAAERVPVCLVLDDLHWADAQSLALLKHLLRPVEQGPLQVIAAYRDSDLGKDHALTGVLADLRALQGVQRIALRGLGEEDVAEIMTAVAGHELEHDGIALAGQISEETDGNPFFVGEILRGLSESGALFFDAATGRWRVDRPETLALPESVREVIERRVERLGNDALEALRLAAVIGRSFDLDLLSAAIDVNQPALLDRLEDAVAASILTESSEQIGRFRFVHALIKQTLYDGLGATRRALLHQRVAEALEELHPDDPSQHLAELAQHWRLAAVSVQTEKAIAYARLAGERALAELAPGEAVRWFSQALELQAQEPAASANDRAALLVGLGDAQRQAGEPSYRETLLEAAALAADAQDADRQARAVLATWRGTSSLGQRDAELVDALKRAAQALPAGDPRRADILAELAAEITFSSPFEQRRELADEALELAREAGDPALVCRVLLKHAYAIWIADTIDERVANFAEARELADRVGDPTLQFFAAARSCNLIEAGDLEGFDAQIARMTELSALLGQPIMRWTLLFSESPRALLAGRLDEAERLATSALEASGGTADGLTVVGGQLTCLRWEQGRLHELLELIEEAVGENPALPVFKVGLAQALCSAGENERAGELLDEFARVGFASIPRDPVWSTAIAGWSEIAFRLGAKQAAGDLYRLLLPHERLVIWGGTVILGPASRHLGRLALTLERYDEAEAHLARASAEHRRIGAPVWQADTDHLLGLTLLRRPGGDRDRGRELLRHAAETAREHGAGLIERAVHEAVSEGSPRG
jgi:class 3 adenylate cyclase